MRPSEFGEKLRLEREGRRTPIERIAERSGVDLRYLEALEQGEFDALPGTAIGKLYVRMYAEVLGFDPGEWLDRYDRAQQQKRRSERTGRDRSPRSRKERPVEAAIERWRASRGVPTGEEDTRTTAPEPAKAPGPSPDDASTEVAAVPDSAEPTAEPELPVTEPPEPEPAEQPSGETVRSPEGTPRRRTASAVAWGVVVVALLVAAVWVAARMTHPDREAGAARPDPVVVDSERETGARSPTDDRAEPRPTPAPELAESVTDDPETRQTEPGGEPSRKASSGRLSVSEYGLGHGVRYNRVVEPSRRFEEGGAAYFLTRVLGGSAGSTVRHVWLREGRIVQTIELPLGGPHWRTHSRKTLYGVGPWAVEARDEQGRVLARAEFSCIAKR